MFIEVIQPDLMNWQSVRIVQIFDWDKDTVFPSLVVIFPDQWGIPLPYKANAGGIPYHIR